MIIGWRSYGVQKASRQPLVDFMLDGLRRAGCRILFVSDASQAPFLITFETRAGERMGLLAYAFLATRTPTRNRPPDERSFQLKYGSKSAYHDSNVHELWQDPLGLLTTILVGIDTGEGFLVGADPEMHNPTKFFIRLEFKDHQAEEIKKQGWLAWERERRAGKEAPVEVLVGAMQENFLDFVRFERAAKGLSQGDRQLLAERPELFADAAHLASLAPSIEPVSASLHPIAREFGLAADEILELIGSARRLKMAVRGWVAEEHLHRQLESTPGVTDCERLDEEGGADIRLRYQGGPPLVVECKNALRKTNAQGLARIDFQRTRASKGDPCSRYYASGDFDVIAGCLHAVTESWEFRYALPANLAGHRKCPGKLASNVLIDASWTSIPSQVFEAAYASLK